MNDNQFLDIMVGPAGAGKSSYVAANYRPSQVISTDAIRIDMFGSFEAREAFTADGLARTFAYARQATNLRLSFGLRTCFDATNLRQRDRFSFFECVPRYETVRYIIVDRPLERKLETRGWRPIELVIKHHETFKRELDNILAGDNLDFVTVLDLRHES